MLLCIKHFFAGGNYPVGILSEGKGEEMSLKDVVFLHPVEAVSLDTGACQSLSQGRLSAQAMFDAEDLFEDFIVCLSSVEAAWSAGEFDRLASQAKTLILLSETLGLKQSAAVAGELSGLVGRGDAVSLAAVVARAVRVGEASLTSVLEYAYRRI